MQPATFAILLISAATFVSGYRTRPHYNLSQAPILFEKFIRDYNRHYKDAADREVHYQAFVATLQEINERNSHSYGPSAVFDINQFADYTPEELEHIYGYLPHPPRT